MKLVMASTVLALAALGAAGERPVPKTAQPGSPVYLVANEDNPVHLYASIFQAGGSPSDPRLTLQKDLVTQGRGIAGGFFGTQRVVMLNSGANQCAFVSAANTGNIGGVSMSTLTATGMFAPSSSDSGLSNGIGMAISGSYLYAGFSDSNTIATFAISPGCQLSFLGDVSTTPLNGGNLNGIAARGNILIVTFGDGSIQSFNIAAGMPVSNNDAQMSTGSIYNYQPVGIDITQDGHFAIFGDASVTNTVEVSDISSGKLTKTVYYDLGPAVSSAYVRLSPDQTLLYIVNSQGGTVSAAFFNAATGKITPGCTSPTLSGFFDIWSFLGGIDTELNTGTGGVLYVGEYLPASSVGIIIVNSDGATCTLTEAPASPVTANGNVLSVATFPPRSF